MGYEEMGAAAAAADPGSREHKFMLVISYQLQTLLLPSDFLLEILCLVSFYLFPSFLFLIRFIVIFQETCLASRPYPSRVIRGQNWVGCQELASQRICCKWVNTKLQIVSSVSSTYRLQGSFVLLINRCRQPICLPLVANVIHTYVARR